MMPKKEPEEREILWKIWWKENSSERNIPQHGHNLDVGKAKQSAFSSVIHQVGSYTRDIQKMTKTLYVSGENFVVVERELDYSLNLYFFFCRKIKEKFEGVKYYKKVTGADYDINIEEQLKEAVSYYRLLLLGFKKEEVTQDIHHAIVTAEDVLRKHGVPEEEGGFQYVISLADWGRR